MRFALLGNDPEGLQMARALLATGRHELRRYAGPKLSAEELRDLPAGLPQTSDSEDVLADPGIEAVIVASDLGRRGPQLHRALQSERHVLCAHPSAPEPETAYRASLLQAEVHQVLLPLLTGSLHPALRRARELFGPLEQATPTEQPTRSDPSAIQTVPGIQTERPSQATPSAGLGEIRMIEIERWSTREVLLNAEAIDHKLCFPDWGMIRALGGEVIEVSVMTPTEQLQPGKPLVLLGRLAQDALFEVRYLPRQNENRFRIHLIGERGEAELVFPTGEVGPAILSWVDQNHDLQEEHWDYHDPWPELVQAFETELRGESDTPTSPSWDDAIRYLELDDAARRSAHRRRAVMIEFPEAGEDINFKSTMTLVGCGILWMIILLAILSQWVPWLKYVVGGMLFLFLVSQMLKWVIPKSTESPSP